jgi:signal transduction histidine kinase
LLAAVVIPTLFGWIRLTGQRAGLYDTEFGLALFVVIMIALFTFIIWTDALRVHGAEEARAAADRSLQESERRLFQILEAMPVGVFVLDQHGRAYYANRASQEILGKGLVAGASVNELPDLYRACVSGTDTPYPPERQPFVRALLGERAHATDVEIHAPDRVIPLDVWAAPVVDGSGRVEFAISAFSDVTMLRQATDRIARLNADLSKAVAHLKEVNDELEAFAYSVSHDLRAPIRHIDGFGRLLAEQLGDRADEKSRHYLGRVLDGARHMGVLIDDLLRLSRVSRQGLSAAPTDLNAVLRSVVYDLREQAGDRQIEWRIDKLPRMTCDPGLLKQVFTNLLANAVKFTGTRDRAVIEVSHQPGDEAPVLYVRDNGVGFDMRYADKLFGVFQRLHRPEEFEGTGVGLATVQRIIHKHGGRIWAESELDKGTAFYFTLGRDAVHGTGNGTD